MIGSSLRTARILAGAAALLALAAPAGAAEYFQGKTVTAIIGGGGGYDTYTRLMAPFYEKHLPGNPKIIARSMPGAGTLTAANYLYEAAPRDGTAFASVGGGTATAELFRTKGIRFDPRRFTWIGSLNSEVGLVCIWHTVPVKTIEDAMQRETLLGGGGPTSGNVIFAIVMNQMLGTRFRIIAGYPSQDEILLATERGEVEGVGSFHYSGIVTRKPDWLEGKVNFLLQLADKRHPAMPNVPTIFEKAKSDDDRRVLELIFARQKMGRPFLAPPDVPAEVATMMRRAFDAMAADPAFLAEAKRGQFELNDIMTGEQIHALVERLYGASPQLVARAIEATDTSHIRAPKKAKGGKESQ